MKSRLRLTQEELSGGWGRWSKLTRERKTTQRFGQWLWNQYGVKGESWPELFYCEYPVHAYQMALTEIGCN